MPLDTPKTYSEAFEDTGDTTFGRAASGWSDMHDGKSGVFPFVNGMDALGARLDMIDGAERSIDLQYFLMKDDSAGLAVASALLNAADRGVRIRFLLDDVFTTSSDRSLLMLNQHPNIEVRLFNPISRRGLYWFNFAGSFSIANRRMHNKSFTVDNAICIVGGRNIADEYYALKDDAVFADFDVLAFGAVSKEVSASFDRYWNHELAVPIEALHGRVDAESLAIERDQLRETTASTYADIHRQMTSRDLLLDLTSGRQPLYVADTTVFADEPDKLTNPVGREYMRLAADIDGLLSNAERELIFVSPYYVPGDDGVRYMRDLVNRGVRVVMVTNSLASNNHTSVHSAYSGYRRDVIDAGVELYEIRANAGRETQGGDGPEKLTLHTKLILVDRRYLFVGSLNLDPRSVEINAEMGLVIDSPELVEKMASGIDDGISSVAYRVTLDEERGLVWHGLVNGEPVTETREPLAGALRRFNAWFLKIVPESQL